MSDDGQPQARGAVGPSRIMSIISLLWWMIMCQITCRQASTLQGIRKGAPSRTWIQATSTASIIGQSDARASYGNRKI